MPGPTTSAVAVPPGDIVRQNRQLLTVKELAWHLNHHPNYVYLMRKAGFKMPANRTTLEAALAWLEKNPSWRRCIPL